MKLTPREKRDFYQQLQKLVEGGLTTPEALAHLARPGNPRASRAFAGALEQSLRAGHPLAQAFRHARPPADALEFQTVAACERSGHLERGFAALSRHFETIHSTRKQILAGLAYPVFLLHFAVLVLGFASSLLKKEGFVVPTLSFLGALYLGAALIWILWRTLVRAASDSSQAAGLLAAIPGPGSAWARFALARFFGVLEMQLGAGINLFQALEPAGSASANARLKTAAARIARAVQNGATFGTAIERETILPAATRKTLEVGEQSGTLDQALARAEADAMEKATDITKATAEWIPRLIYLAVLGYVAYRIIATYADILTKVEKAMDI